MTKDKIKIVLVVLCVFFVSYGIAFAAWDISATISWQANSEPGMYGYKVYIGTESRNYTDYVFVEKTMTSYRFDKLLRGEEYYFCVTSVSSTGVESAYSEEVSKQMLRIMRR